jgi:hypothetical protein
MYCELAIFPERSKVNFSNFEKGESFNNIIEKLIYEKFQLYYTFLTFFSRKYQDFSGNHLSELQKIINLSIEFHNSTSKACSCKISAL